MSNEEGQLLSVEPSLSLTETRTGLRRPARTSLSKSWKMKWFRYLLHFAIKWKKGGQFIMNGEEYFLKSYSCFTLYLSILWILATKEWWLSLLDSQKSWRLGPPLQNANYIMKIEIFKFWIKMLKCSFMSINGAFIAMEHFVCTKYCKHSRNRIKM